MKFPPIPDNIEYNSLASKLMFQVTTQRNRSLLQHGRMWSQIAFPIICCEAAIETTAASIATICTSLLYPISDKPLNNSCTWLKSSFFCIKWAFADSLMNMLPCVLVADEKSARDIASGNSLLRLPRGAVI